MTYSTVHFFAKHIQPIIDKREKERKKSASVNDQLIKNKQTSAKPPSNITQSAVQRNVTYSSIVANNAATNHQAKFDNNSTTESADQLTMSDLKNLLLQNMQLMSAHQELMKKFSCLIE